MQKVTKFLEAYLQWVALGLGLLWILFITYAYWVKSPVVATVTTPTGAKSVGPGDVDDLAVDNDGPVSNLRKALDSKLKIPTAITDELQAKGTPYVKDFQTKMSLAEVAVAPMRPLSPRYFGNLKNGPETPDTTETKFASVVLLPQTLGAVEISNGLSVALVPNPAKPVNPNEIPGNIGVIGPVNPANAVDAPKTFTYKDAPEAVPVLLETRDVGWDTLTARFNTKFLADAFKTAGLPQTELGTTAFLQVRLMRQERQLDGTWGKDLEVPDLTNQAKPAWPPKDPDEEGTYLDWALKNQPDIVQPPFYEILRGNLWRTASMPEMADAGLDPAQTTDASNFDPANVKPGEVSKLSQEQQKLWREWKQQKDQEERDRRKSEAESRKGQQAPKGDTGGGGGGAGPRLPGGKNAPPPANEQPIAPPSHRRSAAAPLQIALAEPVLRGEGSGSAPRPNPRNSGDPGLGSGSRSERAPSGTPTGSPDAAGAPGPGEFSHGVVPTGAFTPVAGELEIWRHDDTAVPGHTYRYKLEVWIKNPLYKNPNAKFPADENKFALVLQNDWSQPSPQPLRQQFFATNGGNAIGNNAKMGFEYFWWEDGQWKLRTLSLQPGDAIPNAGWTIVDFRPKNVQENKAILVNENGEMTTRYYRDDAKDPEYTKLKTLIQKAAAPPAQAAVP